MANEDDGDTSIKIVQKNQDKAIDETDCDVTEKGELFKKRLRPLLLSMAVAGLVHGDSVWSPKNKCGRIVQRIHIFYCLAVMFMLWLNVARYFAAYMSPSEETFEDRIIMKIVMHLWFCMCAVNSTLCYRASSTANKLPMFLRAAGSEQWFKESSKKDTVLVIITVSVAWVYIFYNVGYDIYALLFTHLWDAALLPLGGYDRSHSAQSIRYAYFVLHFYLASAWIFPCGLCLLGAVTIYTRFKTLYEEFSTAVKKDNRVCIEIYRQKHEQVCQLTEIADEIVSGYILCVLSIGIISSLMQIYIIVWNEEARSMPHSFVSAVMWCLGTFFNLAIVVTGGVYVNRMVSLRIHVVVPCMFALSVALLTNYGKYYSLID